MNKEKIGKVRKVIDVKVGDLEEILVGSFEGASNYWLEKVSVKNNDYKGGEYASDVVGLGGDLIIYTNDGESYKLTQPKLINGIQIYVDNGGKHFPFDDGQPDGWTYDTILQNALFGEQVYG